MDIKNLFGAGLKDAKIVNSDGDIIDIYGVVTAEGSTSREETEVRGDDQVLGTFGSSLREELTIEANGLNFEVIEAITGNPVTTTANTAEIDLGTDLEMNPLFVEVQASTNVKLKSGETAEFKKTWHRVQINNISVSQAGEQEFKLTMEGIALQTEQDIQGAAFSPARKKIATIEVTAPEAS